MVSSKAKPKSAVKAAKRANHDQFIVNRDGSDRDRKPAVEERKRTRRWKPSNEQLLILRQALALRQNRKPGRVDFSTEDYEAFVARINLCGPQIEVKHVHHWLNNHRNDDPGLFEVATTPLPDDTSFAQPGVTGFTQPVASNDTTSLLAPVPPFSAAFDGTFGFARPSLPDSTQPTATPFGFDEPQPIATFFEPPPSAAVFGCDEPETTTSPSAVFGLDEAVFDFDEPQFGFPDV